MFAFQMKVCKPSILTPIKYTFSERFFIVDSIYGFYFIYVDHNKQTRFHEHLNFHVEFYLYIGLKNGVSDFR